MAVVAFAAPTAPFNLVAPPVPTTFVLPRPDAAAPPAPPLLPFGEQMVVVPDPNAESTEFSRVCETDGDFDPVDGGLKNESGRLRIRNGTWSGRAF